MPSKNNIKKKLKKFKHNITRRGNYKRSGVQKFSTPKQKLIASLKERNPFDKNYSPNLPPHSKPRPILPTIDTSKQFMRYDPGPRTPGAKPQGFFTKKMIKGPSTPKGIPPPRTPTGPKPKSAFGGKSRRKRRRKKKKTRRRKKKKTRRRRKMNMRGCSKKRRRR